MQPPPQQPHTNNQDTSSQSSNTLGVGQRVTNVTNVNEAYDAIVNAFRETVKLDQFNNNNNQSYAYPDSTSFIAKCRHTIPTPLPSPTHTQAPNKPIAYQPQSNSKPKLTSSVIILL